LANGGLRNCGWKKQLRRSGSDCNGKIHAVVQQLREGNGVRTQRNKGSREMVMCSQWGGKVEPVGEQEEDGQMRRTRICWVVTMIRGKLP